MVALVEDFPDSRMFSDEKSASDFSHEQRSKNSEWLCTIGGACSVSFVAYSFARRIDASDFSRQPDFGPVGWELDARSTGSHCGEHTSRCCASTSLFATLGFVMCGMEAAQMAATTPMRSARKLEAYLFTYTLRWGGLEGTLQGQDARSPGTRRSSRKRVAQPIAASLRPGSSGGVAA